MVLRVSGESGMYVRYISFSPACARSDVDGPLTSSAEVSCMRSSTPSTSSGSRSANCRAYADTNTLPTTAGARGIRHAPSLPGAARSALTASSSHSRSSFGGRAGMGACSVSCDGALAAGGCAAEALRSVGLAICW